MVPSVRTVLLGPERARSRRVGFDTLLAIALFAATFAAYAVEVFAVSGGVVFVPGHAALVGLVAAGALGAASHGLAAGWLAAYGAMLGYHADHAFLGLSSRTRIEQAAYFLELDGLAALAVLAAIVGTLAWTVGAVSRWGVAVVRDGAASFDSAE